MEYLHLMIGGNHKKQFYAADEAAMDIKPNTHSISR